MKSTIKIGRDISNDIVINEPRISRNHAIITDLRDGTFEIKDLGSTNGTFVNGKRITKQIITPDDKVEVATCQVKWYNVFNEPDNTSTSSIIQEDPYAKVCKSISIGTTSENDIVIPENTVSNKHAKISVLKNGNYYIQDLGSSNGTFVNGIRVKLKNFTKTDIVKIASSDLPQNWFLHKNLQRNVFMDHKRSWLISLALMVVVTTSVLIYFYKCQWFDCGCDLSAEQIYLKSKNSLVYIVHDYFYTIKYEGKTYYVGRNIIFKVTEANTNKENLLPFSSVSGSGCFIKKDGTIMTSVLIVNPWLNVTEKDSMLEEVIRSKTISDFSLDRDYKIGGETEELKFLAEGYVNNIQNYVAATSVKSNTTSDDYGSIIQSVKKTLPENSKIIDCITESRNKNKKYFTDNYYYSISNLMGPASTLQDTFYITRNLFETSKTNSASINKRLPDLPEGSLVLNERGELVGNIQQKKLHSLALIINN